MNFGVVLSNTCLIQNLRNIFYSRESTRDEPSAHVSADPKSPPKSTSTLYDATTLHTFIRETFPGATLLEEHQVCPNNYIYIRTIGDLTGADLRL